MSRVTFNRKRGRNSRSFSESGRGLHLLALILVAPLMLWSAPARSKPPAPKWLAAASTEFTSLAQHTADLQREVISSVETMLKAAAYIRASAGGVSRSCDIPARQPAGQYAVDRQHDDCRQG